jgi:hypothetical protein
MTVETCVLIIVESRDLYYLLRGKGGRAPSHHAPAPVCPPHIRTRAAIAAAAALAVPHS